MNSNPSANISVSTDADDKLNVLTKHMLNCSRKKQSDQMISEILLVSLRQKTDLWAELVLLCLLIAHFVVCICSTWPPI